MPEVPLSGEYHQVHEVGGSRQLLLVFSSIAVRPPKFSYYKLAKEIGANVLYLNDDLKSWYRSGIKSLGENPIQTVRAIKKIARDLGAEKIYTTGNSMGAFGALHYGSLLNADGILAIDPEVRLGIYKSKSYTSGEVRYGQTTTDISDYLFRKATVVYSQTDLMDILSASRLVDRAGVTVKGVMGPSHGTSEHLNRRNLLVPAFQELITGKPVLPSLRETGLAGFKDMATNMLQLHAYLSDKKFRLALHELEIIVKATGTGLPISYFSGVIHFRLKNFNEAKSHLTRVHDHLPEWGETTTLLGLCFQRTGDLATAIPFLRSAAKSPQAGSMCWFQYAEALLAAGETAEAQNALMVAIRINPERPEYQVAKARYF